MLGLRTIFHVEPMHCTNGIDCIIEKRNEPTNERDRDRMKQSNFIVEFLLFFYLSNFDGIFYLVRLLSILSFNHDNRN